MAKPLYMDFAYIKQHADFRAILAHFGVLLPEGDKERIKVRCPFHQDEHPSLSINLQKKVFHCFGCGAEGDVIEFVGRAEQLIGHPRRAAARVAELSGGALAPERGQGRRAHPKQRRTRPQTAPGCTESTRDALLVTPAEKSRDSAPPAASEPVINPPLRFALTLNPDHPYLKARGIPPEVARAFGLGHASRGLMKGRIAIAIHNERDELIAYAGRWPAKDGWPQGEDKYKLPEGFKKRHVLFNLHRCLDETGRLPGGHLVLVEGYFGALWLYRLGFPAVALMGRSLSPEQQALLKQVGVERLSLMLDGDAPGRAAVAIMLPVLAPSFFVHDIVLPEGAQPDTLDEASVPPLLD